MLLTLQELARESEQISVEESPRPNWLERKKQAIRDLKGSGWWIFPFAGLALGAGFLITLFTSGLKLDPYARSGDRAIGHVTRAHGTVRLSSWLVGATAGSAWESFIKPVGLDASWNRLETGRGILVPFAEGDVIQTGEESGAQLLFFGGSRLDLDKGTVARFNREDGGDISVRLLMGRAFLDISDNIKVRQTDGAFVELPEGKRLVLTLNTAQDMYADPGEGLPDVDGHESLANLELKLLSEDERTEPLEHAYIVPPILDSGGKGLFQHKHQDRVLAMVPPADYPLNDQDFNVEIQRGVSFQWQKVATSEDNSITAYEVVVRPAPGYLVEDTARKVQYFRTRTSHIPLDKINGSGVFLWSVRAVLANGERGAGSAPRWLEVKFPALLSAPKVIKPKIE